MVDLALGARRSQDTGRFRNALRDFLAIGGLFGTLYAWFIVGAALTA